MRLRDYQLRAHDACLMGWLEHQSLMIVLPTGMGKTEIFVSIADLWQRGRVLIVAPMIQLVSQAAKKITQRTGIAPGIEQGGLRSNENIHLRSPFIVASKQSLLSKKRYKRLGDIGLVVVDECHLAATEQYGELLTHFRQQGSKVLGCTATPKRHDRIAMANLFEHCPFEMYIYDAVQEGWLVPSQATCVQLEELDLSAVGTKGSRGDFKDGELAQVMEQEKVCYEIADVTARESGAMKTAIYCASVKEARAVAEYLVDRYGKQAEWICSDKRLCSDDKRREVLQSFTEDPDGLQFVANVGILTTGWDFPGLEHIVMARPTKSLALYTQVYGRGTRPLAGVVDFPGSCAESRKGAIASSRKPHFRITDLVDNSMHHKLVSAADVLGGKMELAVVERAKKNINKAGGPLDLDQALLDANREEEEEKERRRRAAIEAKARYKRVDVDPFDGSRRSEVRTTRRGPRMLFGKHKGKLIADVPTGYLEWMIHNANLRAGWFKNAVEKEYKSRFIGAK